MSTIVRGVEEFRSLVGTHLGYSEWQVIDQKRVNLFADATGDHQWIHVDPERAKTGPFGGAIAHGYLTLSLAPAMLGRGAHRRGDDVRRQLRLQQGPLPLAGPGGLRAAPRGRRGRVSRTSQDGVQVTIDLTFEVQDAPKPSCVAQVVYRYYR